MEQPHDPLCAHPAGERFFPSLKRIPAWPVDTPGGRYYAEINDDAPVTREGQLIFFAQFLHSGGRWERLLRGCPLHYSGNRGSAIVDVLGTAALSILCGHWRYAHINAVRGDTLNPPLLGMTRAVSEDVVRRAMKRIDERSGLTWLAEELRDCVAPVLRQPWILDIDCTIKALYGHQQGAQIGYNPHKPGRPSHCYPSYFMANTRMCLGVEVCGGKEHAAKHGLPGLWALLDALPRTHWPAFLRGDCAYGNEALLCAAEARELPYLCKLRHTAKVKTLLRQMQRAGAAWQDAGDGWEVLEASLRLSGWSRARRVVLVREVPALAPVGANARRRCDRMQPALPGSADWAASAAPWAGKIAVLVTSLDPHAYPAIAMARLYRERADAENVYDELKNQWGSCRLHHAKARPLPADGQPHRAALQLVAPLRAALRRRAPSRSHHQPSRIAPRRGAAHPAQRPAHRQSEPAARKERPHRASYHRGQQHLAAAQRHRGAMDHRATLDPPAHPYLPPLAGRKMAWRTPTPSRPVPLRLNPSPEPQKYPRKPAGPTCGLVFHSRF